MPRWVHVIGIKSLGMRQQCLRQLAPFHLIIRQRAVQIIMQRLQRGIAVNPREAAFLIDHFPIAHHSPHGAGLGPLHHGIQGRREFIKVWIGDAVPINQRQIRALADLQRAEAVAPGCGTRAPHRCHA